MPSDIISLAELKTYLQQNTTDFDTILGLIRTAADAFVRRFCDREFTQETYTQYYDGNGKDSLLLRHYPIISITSIHLDPDRVFGADTQISASDIILSDENKELGYVELLGGEVFSAGKKNVKIVYVAGYATVPGDLKLATLGVGAREFMLQDKALNGQTNQNVGDRSINLSPEDLPRNVWMVLEAYKRRAR